MRTSRMVVLATLTLAATLVAAPAGAATDSPSPACNDWNSAGWDGGQSGIVHTNRSFAEGEVVWVEEDGIYTGSPTGISLTVNGNTQTTTLGSGVTLSYEIPADGLYDYTFVTLPSGYNGVYWNVGCTPASVGVPVHTGEVGVVQAGAGTINVSPFAFSESVDDWKARCEGTGGVTRTRRALGTPGDLEVHRLTPGVDYQCRVRGHNASGWGPWSDLSPGSVTVIGKPSAPTITDVTAVQRGLNVSFDAPGANGSAIDRYKVWCTNGEDHQRFRNTAGTVFTMPYLRGAQEYMCRVRAGNEYGLGPWSDGVAGTPERGVFSPPG